jgi:hypothetical protein
MNRLKPPDMINMKKNRLFIGILLGGIIACFILVAFNLSNPIAGTKKETDATDDPAKWDWPTSLDALVAAPGSHKLIYEDDEKRILEFTVNPGQTDPIHTYKGKSIVWVVKTSPIIYTTYRRGQDSKLVPLKKDTIITRQDELNKANWENPRPPHSVENIGTDTFRVYRIEYKDKSR